MAPPTTSRSRRRCSYAGRGNADRVSAGDSASFCQARRSKPAAGGMDSRCVPFAWRGSFRAGSAPAHSTDLLPPRTRPSRGTCTQWLAGAASREALSLPVRQVSRRLVRPLSAEQRVRPDVSIDHDRRSIGRHARGLVAGSGWLNGCSRRLTTEVLRREARGTGDPHPSVGEPCHRMLIAPFPAREWKGR